ncbi:MAG TPA: hypothetical protein VFZ59_08280 [Verrucomicrobiae bacterium]|nr:hypothetical protein [Verrucomicrobiae bacterium]
MPSRIPTFITAKVLLASLVKCVLAVALSGLMFASARAALITTCVYDENAISSNVVDRAAAFLGGSGAGDKPSLIPDLRSFSSAIATACQNGFGGVVDFESGELDTPVAFTISFNNGSKSLVIQQNTESAYVIRSYVNEVRTPISGTRALAKEMGSSHFEFAIGGLRGGTTDEQVVAVGLTVLGRNNSNTRSQWTGVALIRDLAGNVGTITNRVTNLNTGEGNRTDDVFFGFRAPVGYFITSVLILSDTGAFTSVDDLAFMTATVVDPVISKAVSAPSAPSSATTTLPTESPSTEPTSTSSGSLGPEWLIVGALGVIILLLLGLILALKRMGRNASLLPVPASPSISRTVAGQAVVTVEPAIDRSQVSAELTEFAKQELVQGLYSQRQALIETQKLAEQRLAELEKWLGQLQLPLQDRIRAYEERIAGLEKELISKDESVRELTKATLLLVRRKLEEEKERERSFSRFS